jgi:capsular exopolysaccharide synthesis family protein
MVLVLGLGIMLGILVASTTVLFLEMRDRSLKTLKEVRELFRYPLLGVIPPFGKNRLPHHQDTKKLTASEIPVRDEPYSLASEMYRMIQNKLKFLGSDKGIKIIAVTSSVPQEGKSTVSANLAAAIAQLGRRVLLVDGDMRNSFQDYIWGLNNTVGLSEVLLGKTDFGIAACEVMDNLDVLPAGVMPPNPLALLESERMTSLIKNFSDKYDFVIIDAPSLLVTADTLTLGQMTDGILLVARLGVIDAVSVKAAKEMLEFSGQKVLGLVVNEVIPNNEPNNYLHYANKY